MKTVACLAAILGSAAAFAPAQEAKQTTALAAFENESEFSPFGSVFATPNMLEGSGAYRCGT
jgi:hypothetical protein